MRLRTQRLVLNLLLALSAGAAAAEVPRLFELAPGEVPRVRGLDAAWRVAVDQGLVTGGAGRLQLDLPDGLQFVAQRRELVRRGVDSALWRGRLVGRDRGDVVLSLTEGVLSGYISSPYGEYEVRPLADGGYLVAKIDSDRLTGCDTPAAAAPPGADPAGPPASPPIAGDGPGSIDILVLFSPQARDQMGGVALIKSRIQLMVDTANTAFQNSRMNARLNLVHSVVSAFQETGDGETDLIALRTHNQTRNLRERYKADLAALVVAQSDDICGIGYLMPTVEPWFADWAVSLTNLLCLTTFGHEVGHNLGMQHDPPNAEPGFDAVFPGGFGHYVAGHFRTVMSYPDPCGSNCVRIPNFSNPRVTYEGVPTGIENQRDNARLGNFTAPVVANYKLSGVAFQDDFESGTAASWEGNQGPLRVVAPGLGGSGFALEVPLTGTSTRRFVMHRLGAPGMGVNVEFTINMNDADLGGAEVAVLSFLGKGQEHTALRVRQIGAAYWAILYVRPNTGPYREVARTPLRAHVDETLSIEWLQAAGPGIADGFVRLAKNGGYRGFLRDVANDNWPVRAVRFGAPTGTIGAPSGGTFLVDNYRATIPAVEEPAP